MDSESTPASEQATPVATPQPEPTPAVEPKGDTVPTRDLMALKKSLEGQLETAKQQAEVDATALKGQIDTLTNQLSQAQAKASATEESTRQGAIADEAVAEAKRLLEAANGRSEELATKLLEARKLNIISGFSVPESKLEGKTLEELGHLEEALKIVASTSSGSVGNYAAGGGGTGAAPQTERERALAIVARAEERGGTVKASSSGIPT